jgi:hypothetical protein
MWNKRKSQEVIKEIIEKYGREIAIDGSDAVLGLEQHLDRMVAKLMGIETEVITIARQWRAVIERAAITEGIDKVILLIEEGKKEEKIAQLEDVNKTREIEMNVEIEEQKLNSVTEVANTKMCIDDKANENIITNKQSKDILEVMEDIRVIDNEEKDKHSENDKNSTGIYTSEDEREENLKQVAEYSRARFGSATLSSSMWAPKADACNGKRDIKAKVAAINVIGENAEHRKMSIKWALRGNKHVKEIKEVFNGNQWCIVHFDCKKGYEEAKRKLERKKEEVDYINLILEEEEDQKNQEEKEAKRKEKKEEREKQARLELREIQKKRKEVSKYNEKNENTKSKVAEEKREFIRDQAEVSKIVQDENKDKRRMPEKESSLKRKGKGKLIRKEYEDEDEDLWIRKEEAVTIWDLPYYVTRTQVFYASKHMGRIRNIDMIREENKKTRAEVTFEEGKAVIKNLKAWTIPFANNLLVRVTPGLSKKEILESRKQFMLKLYNIPQEVNEVLLFRQLKHTEAKAVHIFKNSNGNNKGYAIVSFETKKELEHARSYSITYYNTKLYWEANKENYEEMDFEEKEQEEYKTTEFKERKIIGKESRVRREEKYNKEKEKNNYTKEERKEDYEQNKPKESLAYIVQFIQGLERKISNIESEMGREVPNRS